MDDTFRQERLNVYRAEVGACIDCRAAGLIHQEDGRWAYPLFHKDASCPSGVVIVAEAPNWEDTFNPAKCRLTYDIDTDPTGVFARKLLSSVGLKAGDVLFTNSVLCLPAGRNGKHPVSSRLRDQCSPKLKRLICDLEPKVVVTFGAKALEAVSRVEPHGLSLKSSAGRPHSWFGRWLLPLYHPGRLGRIWRPED